MREPNTSGKSPLRISDSYEAFPRQKEFHESRAKYRLFGGAAGPGKTKALLWEAIRQALEVDGCDTLLLRRTYPELESSLLAYFRRDVPRSMYKSYNESKHIVTWKNGSTTRFGHCRNEKDVYQYQGAEFLFIGIDELTHFSYKQWQFLTSRNRCPARVYSDGKNAGKRIVPCMAGATNPGNIGHAWVKALWVDKKPPAGFDRPELYDENDYQFIPARLEDNPTYANDTDYRRSLETLPEHLRRAFLEGDWNVFAGQYFDVFNRERHVVRLAPGNLGVRGAAGVQDDVFEMRDAGAGGIVTPAKHSDVSDSERTTNADRAQKESDVILNEGRFGRSEGSASPSTKPATMDDSSSPLSGSFVTKNAPQDDKCSYCAPQDDNVREGALAHENHVAQENLAALASVSLEPWWTRWISIDWGFEHPSAVLWHAAAPNGCVVTYREFVQNRLSPRMLAAAIAERCAGERIGATYLSPDAFAQRSAGDTIAEQLAHGLEMEGLPRPDPADNDRVGGWMLMYEMLREDAWLITRNCEGLIESLPTLTRDEENIEDVLKCAGDDVADAARYGIKSRLDARHSPHAGFAEQVMRRGEKISAEDPTSRAIWMRQVEAEARRKRGGAPAPRRWRV